MTAIFLGPFNNLFDYLLSHGIDPAYVGAVVIPGVFYLLARNDLRNWKGLSDWDKRQYYFAFVAIGLVLLGALLRLVGLLKYN